MALTKDDTILDIDKDRDNGDELKFRDFGDSNIEADRDDGQTHTFDNYPSDNEDDEGKAELLTGRKKPPSFWTFEYYQTFFDVETYQVLRRLVSSFIPKPNSNFLTDIRPNPDLYGPFWVCITLVFTTAITGDISNYFTSAGNPDLRWKPDFKKVSIAASAIFCYWWVIASLLWGVLSWRRSPAGYTYLEIICVYGYSLAIYIPVSFLYVIPSAPVQWILMGVALALSGAVLLLTFWPAVKDDDKKFAIGIMVAIFLFHALLAVGFKFYFFKAPDTYAVSTLPPILAHTTHPIIPEKPQELPQVIPDQTIKQHLPEQSLQPQDPAQLPFPGQHVQPLNPAQALQPQDPAQQQYPGQPVPPKNPTIQHPIIGHAQSSQVAQQT